MGWWRGVEVLDEERTLIVGFSRLRHTKWCENIRWVKHRAGQLDQPKLPTRIVSIDVPSRTVNWDINLEMHELGEFFSIIEIE